MLTAMKLARGAVCGPRTAVAKSPPTYTVLPTISTTSTYSVNAPGVAFTMPQPLRGVGEYSFGWLGTVGTGTVVVVVSWWSWSSASPGRPWWSDHPSPAPSAATPAATPPVGGTHAATASAAALAATMVTSFRRPAFIFVSPSCSFVFGYGWIDSPWTARPPIRAEQPADREERAVGIDGQDPGMGARGRHEVLDEVSVGRVDGQDPQGVVASEAVVEAEVQVAAALLHGLHVTVGPVSPPLPPRSVGSSGDGAVHPPAGRHVDDTVGSHRHVADVVVEREKFGPYVRARDRVDVEQEWTGVAGQAEVQPGARRVDGHAVDPRLRVGVEGRIERSGALVEHAPRLAAARRSPDRTGRRRRACCRPAGGP